MTGLGPRSFSFVSATIFIPVLFDTWVSWDMFWCFLGPTHPISITRGLIPHKYINVTRYRLIILRCDMHRSFEHIWTISRVELQMDTDGFMSLRPWLVHCVCVLLGGSLPRMPQFASHKLKLPWRPLRLPDFQKTLTDVKQRLKLDIRSRHLLILLVVLFFVQFQWDPKHLPEERIHSWPHCREGSGNETLEVREGHLESHSTFRLM